MSLCYDFKAVIPSPVFYLFIFLDPSIPNVQVTRLTLMCDAAPAPLTLDLQGEWRQPDKHTIILKQIVLCI